MYEHAPFRRWSIASGAGVRLRGKQSVWQGGQRWPPEHKLLLKAKKLHETFGEGHKVICCPEIGMLRCHRSAFVYLLSIIGSTNITTSCIVMYAMHMFSYYYLLWPRLCQSLCVAWQKIHKCEACSHTTATASLTQPHHRNR